MKFAVGMKQESQGRSAGIFTALAALLSLSSCTGQLPGSFRLEQQVETFNSQVEVNTRIDLLFVVDNSASMDVSQEKLRRGFESFAQHYMKPTWDIRVAVITTDAYLADPAFQPWLETVISGTTGWQSDYVASRTEGFADPDWTKWPSGSSARRSALWDSSSQKFSSGIRYGELIPVWGPNWAKLLPGLHDGPIPALCSELLPHFLLGATRCSVRDQDSSVTADEAIERCLDPDTDEEGVSRCVNTVQNDLIRSGRAIIETLPGEAETADEAFSERLVRDFKINVSTGSAGQGSERGLGSLTRFLADNEAESSETRFFRADSVRGIVFVTDEEDQSLRIPETTDASFSPRTGYKCDQAGLLALNGGSAVINGAGGVCCSSGCSYGSAGTTCASKTVDGFTYTPSICADPDQLVPVEEVHSQLQSFFNGLDGAESDAANASWFVTAIVPLTGEAIQELQADRDADDRAAGSISTFAVDRGDRYLELVELAGNGSMSMNIADEDYSPILESIGNAILEKKSTFTLERAPTGEEDMLVSIVHADGTTTEVDSSKYEVRGESLVFTDLEFLLSLSATDRISIDYQPSTLF